MPIDVHVDLLIRHSALRMLFVCCLQVADPAPEVHQKVLMVLGNLVSDAVDPQVISRGEHSHV